MKNPVWIPTHETLRLLKPLHKSEYLTQKFICKRAHAGLLRAKAERFMMDNKTFQDEEIPKEFWWAEGESALTQDWTVGDFETYINRGDSRLRAFGVQFAWEDFKPWIPDSVALPDSEVAIAEAPTATSSKGGRPKADWWEDLLIEICFQHFRGDLKPKVQADVERAMQEWITNKGYEAASSTVRSRARKVWQAIKSEGGN